MSEENQDKVGQSKTAPDDISRRRILKGLTAVPAIATLGAASNIAAASIIGECIAKEQPANPVLDPTKIVTDGGTNVYYCDTAVGTPAQGVTSPEIQVAIGDPLLAPDGLQAPPSILYEGGPGQAALADRAEGDTRCVLYVDQNSNLTFNSTDNSLISASCAISAGFTRP